MARLDQRLAEVTKIRLIQRAPISAVDKGMNGAARIIWQEDIHRFELAIPERDV